MKVMRITQFSVRGRRPILIEKLCKMKKLEKRKQLKFVARGETR